MQQRKLLPYVWFFDTSHAKFRVLIQAALLNLFCLAQLIEEAVNQQNVKSLHFSVKQNMSVKRCCKYICACYDCRQTDLNV